MFETIVVCLFLSVCAWYAVRVVIWARPYTGSFKPRVNGPKDRPD